MLNLQAISPLLDQTSKWRFLVHPITKLYLFLLFITFVVISFQARCSAWFRSRYYKEIYRKILFRRSTRSFRWIRCRFEGKSILNIATPDRSSNTRCRKRLAVKFINLAGISPTVKIDQIPFNMKTSHAIWRLITKKKTEFYGFIRLYKTINVINENIFLVRTVWEIQSASENIYSH